MRMGVQCDMCKNYIADFTCSAFPKGIPTKILTDEISHKKHIDGDKNIKWEPFKK